MADQNARIDDNNHKTLLGVTDDANEEIRRLLVDPTTGALLCSATVVASSGYQTVQEEGVSLTQRTTLNFIGAGITAADDAGNLRTNVTLDSNLSDIANLGNPGADRILFWDNSAGALEWLEAGSGLTITGTVMTASGTGGYDTIELNGTPLTQRSVMNFSTLFTITDDVPNAETDITINITNLETTLNLANISGQIDLSTQVTGVLNATNIDLTSVENNIDLTNITTGILDISLIGPGSTTPDPNQDAIVFWDDSANQVDFLLLGHGLTIDDTTINNAVQVNQAAHGFSAGDVIRSSTAANTYALAQANNSANAEVLGVVIEVIDPNNFVFAYDGRVEVGVPLGTPGSAIYLSPTVAGGVTTTIPTVPGQVVKPVGVIVESGVAAMWFNYRGASIVSGGGSTGTANEVTITQTGHGFVIGNVVRSDGTANSFTLAQADSGDNAEVVGIVVTVPDANTFSMVTSGEVTAGVPVGTPGDVLFLSPTTAGGLTTTKPTTIGQVDKPVAVLVDSGVRMYWLNYRGEEITATTVGATSQLSSGITRIEDFIVPEFNVDASTNNSLIYSFKSAAGAGSFQKVIGEAGHPGIIRYTVASSNTAAGLVYGSNSPFDPGFISGSASGFTEVMFKWRSSGTFTPNAYNPNNCNLGFSLCGTALVQGTGGASPTWTANNPADAGFKCYYEGNSATTYSIVAAINSNNNFVGTTLTKNLDDWVKLRIQFDGSNDTISFFVDDALVASQPYVQLSNEERIRPSFEPNGSSVPITVDLDYFTLQFTSLSRA